MRRIPALLLCVVLGAACSKASHSTGLTHREIEYLSEDVHDLSAIVFQAGENAYFGDTVFPGEIIEEAQAGNGWTVTYELPAEFRIGLGYGVGRVRLQVVADGAAVTDPLAFSFASTAATDVEMRYELTYEGETLGGRLTDVAFDASLKATRPAAAGTFLVEYWIKGDCWLGSTLCRMTLRFEADGAPNNLLAGIADAAGVIDDPDVRADFDLDYDFDGFGGYVAEGWVGCCAWFRERFTVPG